MFFKVAAFLLANILPDPGGEGIALEKGLRWGTDRRRIAALL